MKNEIKRPNEEGATYCIVRYMMETDNGWIGSWDKEALEQFIIPNKPGLQNFEKKWIVEKCFQEHGTMPLFQITEIELLYGPDKNGKVCVLKSNGSIDLIRSSKLFNSLQQAETHIKLFNPTL